MKMTEPRYSIETNGLTVFYGSLKAIDNVKLRIPHNAVFAIMGPSGSGKSTLLRTFNKLITLNPEARVKGTVKLFGRNIYAPNVSMSPISRMIGMVFQVPNPFPHLSIYDNVAIGPRLNGLVKSRRELDKLVEWALRKAALWDEVRDRLKAPAPSLSGGQQQRLCIARALAMRPKILLMDEPTSNLDPVSAKKIEDLIVELKRGMTVVIVTHDQSQARRVADYAALLLTGRLVKQGPTHEVLSKEFDKLIENFVDASSEAKLMAKLGRPTFNRAY